MSEETPTRVVAVEADRPSLVAARLREVRTEVNALFIEMGELLLEAKRNNYAGLLGYTSFEEFVEDRLEMHLRKALYLADVVGVFIEQLNVPREVLAKTGWSKAKEIIPLIRSEVLADGAPTTPSATAAAVGWLEHASERTTNELNLEIRQRHAPPGQPGELRQHDPFTISCFKDEREIIEKAIEYAKRDLASDRNAKALVMICSEFIAEAEARQAQVVPQRVEND